MEPNKNRILYISKIIIIAASILGLIAIILEYGFNISHHSAELLHLVSLGVVIAFFLYQGVNFALATKKKEHLKTHKIEFFFISTVLLEIVLSIFDYSLVAQLGDVLHLKDVAFLYIVFAQVSIVLGFILGGLRFNNNILQLKIHPSRLFILSFLVTILFGALLLMLPAATVAGNISFIDALFTSTSAVCVTGLITQDTATYFTFFGQIVIMLLFQIGGLGLMTFTTFFALFLSGGLGIKERILLHDLLDEDNIGQITRVLSFLTIATFLIEIIGAAILFLSIHHQVPNLSHAIFLSVFHSISAFCNAGFSLFSLNLMDGLVIGNHVFTLTIAFLIILGGLGFPTILNLWTRLTRSRKQPFKKHNPIQTKMVLFTTLGLILLGTVWFYTFELNNTMKDLGFFERLSAAFFQSVTTRTAGFNTVDFAKMGIPTILMVLFLMFVGASPGGTGGGIRTTTFAIMYFGTLSILRNQKSAHFGNRTIPKEIILKAFIKTFFSIAIISAGIIILTITEEKDLLDIMFESFSAFGTVGLSRGITADLTVYGKLIISFLMFVGRVGPLAFIYSILKPIEQPNYDLPFENISIL